MSWFFRRWIFFSTRESFLNIIFSRKNIIYIYRNALGSCVCSGTWKLDFTNLTKIKLCQVYWYKSHIPRCRQKIYILYCFASGEGAPSRLLEDFSGNNLRKTLKIYFKRVQMVPETKFKICIIFALLKLVPGTKVNFLIKFLF